MRDPVENVIHTVLDAITVVLRESLRSCPHCGALFWKVRKQQYCSPVCSQKARWARFTATRPPRDYRRERETRRRDAVRVTTTAGIDVTALAKQLPDEARRVLYANLWELYGDKDGE